MLIFLKKLYLLDIQKVKYLKIINIVTSKYLKITKNVQNTENIYLFSFQIFKLD